VKPARVDTAGIIARTSALNRRLRKSIIAPLTEKRLPVLDFRPILAMAYWQIVFETHRGLLVLLRNDCFAPAFALQRVLHEAAMRLFLVTFGTERQVEAIWKGTYQTDFRAVAKQIDEKTKHSGALAKMLNDKVIRELHGFTHSGSHQWLRQFRMRKTKDGGSAKLVPRYSGAEVRRLLSETMVPVLLTVLFTTDFFNLEKERRKGLEIIHRHVKLLAGKI
jgi:Family of unknown function (DUF6988)